MSIHLQIELILLYWTAGLLFGLALGNNERRRWPPWVIASIVGVSIALSVIGLYAGDSP